MKLCVIPARGGSKRIPRKNIKNFCGKPMIAWSIIAASKSNCFDKIIVSTDDEEIAAVAKHWGADVPFMRPIELANDYAGTTEVVSHAVKWHIENDADVKDVCCLYATAPFTLATDIQKGYMLLDNHEVEFVFSVTSYAFPIQRAIKITDDNRIKMFSPESYGIRSQDLDPYWHDAGQFYWGSAISWLHNKPIFSTCSMPIVLPRYRVQDIDTAEDWIYAEKMFKILNHLGE